MSPWYRIGPPASFHLRSYFMDLHRYNADLECIHCKRPLWLIRAKLIKCPVIHFNYEIDDEGNWHYYGQFHAEYPINASWGSFGGFP